MKEVRFLGLGKGLFFMKRKFRNIEEIVTRLVTIAILSALGVVLMALVQVPYPIAPWLKIEISELTTIIGYALYGLPGGIAISVIKTLANMLIRGPSALGLGDATAFITSCMFIIGLFVTSRLKLFKKGLGFRVIAYVAITIFVSFVMTLLNALFITPTYLAVFSPNPKFTTCFDEGAIQGVTSYLTGKKDVEANGWMYIGAISYVYGPFNLMKAAACCLLYEVIFNRLIFVFMRRSTFFKKYFVGSIFTKKEEEDNPDIVVEEEQPQE